MFCPVCNGIQSLHVSCSSCASATVDCGRSSDLTGPYAPYEQIKDEPLFSDMHLFDASSCKHLLYCSTCNQTSEVTVNEW
ncbi:hypothetical protein [Paenibacillus luteus]|uniref:hypothetical protein n=1 Tax=Paenibacillus luteus TaxID=2545753 RepID=UPI0011415055|nr:hypothetical protein [Paenibacillus luteus]